MIVFLGISGAVIGAIIAEITVGWTYMNWYGPPEHINPGAIAIVVIGLIIGILIGIFSKKLFSTIERSKDTRSDLNADEIDKLKNLLDNGAITQEEFDEKKKQLLGL